jgi:hypothetical protein
MKRKSLTIAVGLVFCFASVAHSGAIKASDVKVGKAPELTWSVVWAAMLSQKQSGQRVYDVPTAALDATAMVFIRALANDCHAK